MTTTTRTTRRLTGYAAIDAAEVDGTLCLMSYATPIDGARSNLTLAEARQLASEDPSLVYVDASYPATP